MAAEVGKVQYKVELDDSGVEQQASQTESKLKSKFGAAAKAVGAAATAAVAAGAAAMVSITKQAVSSYAEYEQLVGGVETLFEDLSDDVIENASKAYKTAGLSANEYMDTVMSFSASLNQSLLKTDGDIARSAEMADKAILDMSDNANKMGSDMATIQTAYAGFAKQNYTMLDNLKLGYGGTKEEMERLLKDAGKLANTKFNLNSYADIIEAIHVIQEDMGITGTTAKEAAATISGSLGMTKAAWQNLLTGMVDSEADINQLIDDLISSASSLLDNLIPAVSRALEGLGTAIADAAPRLAEEIPPLIEKVLPPLLESGAKVIETLAKGIVKAIPMLMPTITQLLLDLAQMIIKMAPEIVKTGLEVITQLALGIAKALPRMMPTIVDCIVTIVETLIDNADMLIDAAIAIILTLADGLIQSQDKLIAKAPELVTKLTLALIQAAPKLLEAAIKLIFTLVEGLVSAFPKLIEAGKQTVESVKKGFNEKFGDAKSWGRDLMQNFINGIKEQWDHLKQTVSNVAQTVKSYLHFSMPDVGPLKDFNTYAPDMMDLYAKGIRDNTSEVEDTVADVSRRVSEAFTTDVSYNLPDISGYAADLSAAITATSSTSIIVPLSIDGREIARASAWYMNEQLAWEAR